MNVMEITAPRGSMRLVDFPTFKEFRPSDYSLAFVDSWRSMGDKERLIAYSKKRHKVYRQQCQGIRAFMKQHKRRNGHNRKAVS